MTYLEKDKHATQEKRDRPQTLLQKYPRTDPTHRPESQLVHAKYTLRGIPASDLWGRRLSGLALQGPFRGEIVVGYGEAKTEGGIIAETQAGGWSGSRFGYCYGWR